MKASEVLRQARALIEKEEDWTQGAEWRDADGMEVDPVTYLENPAYYGGWYGEGPQKPAQMCAAGSILWVEHNAKADPFCSTAQTLLNRVARKLQGPAAVQGVGVGAAYNDAASHADVLTMFDLAISAALAQEALGDRLYIELTNEGEGS